MLNENISMEDRGFTFFYFMQLSPSGGAFLAEMTRQQNWAKWQGNWIGLNGGAKKLVQKRPVEGTKCVK